MKNYPDNYLNSMRQLLGNDFDAYMASLEMPREEGLHVNTLKIDADSLAGRFGGLAPIPWSKDGFYCTDDMKPSSSSLYHAGLFYIQEPSAQSPAALLPVTPGERVLDLCAAPGGKSLQLACALQDEGLLFANDISAGRAGVLTGNLELAGVKNFCVTAENPDRLASFYPGFFDKILVDAPCSGEGMFRKDPKAVSSWLEKGPLYYAPLQKSILEAADRMLKEGGMLMYSTCTFSKEEDEDVILSFLSEHPGYEPVRIPACEGFSEGNAPLKEAVRLYPFRIKGEGHFLCLLFKKESGNKPGAKQPEGAEKRIQGKLPAEVCSFLKNTPFCQEERLVLEGEKVLLLPEKLPRYQKVRYLRTGLFCGTFAKGRFTPSQALAYALKAENYPWHLDYDDTDSRIIRYLKGETLTGVDADFPKDAWILVCAGGFGCGWGKISSSNLKNKLDPARRIR
ncbi:MAG: RsmB/NOP family class I SAM-dependent RNA methyltransferase [Eubacterium sp.]|nr:RsmB/NOP family class I SAM-dependent RNA methyltransferase [Eubacterium sp.]